MVGAHLPGSRTMLLRTTSRSVLALCIVLGAAACADDDKDTPVNLDADRPDAGLDSARDADDTADAASDTDSDSTSLDSDLRDDLAGDDTDGTGTDDVFNEDALVPPVEPARTDDWECDRQDRVEACTAPLIEPTAPPTDPDDLLFYVNRVEAISADYPINADSTWTPCAGGVDPAPGAHDLVCVPDRHNSGALRALRQIAWSSPAPVDYTATWDGRPVGFRGRVGFEAMFEAAAAEADVDLFVVSGFRSYATQVGLHESYVAREMDTGLSEADARIVAATYSARPGHSEHQLGTTADITFRRDDGSIFDGLSATMGASRSFLWVRRNAHRFGIVLTYDQHRVEETQYVYEPWHYRFVGVEAADQMAACGLNTEEFLAARYGAAPLPEWGGEPWTLYGDLTLLEHVTLPPGSWAATGAEVRKTWRVQNSGTTNWWDYLIVQTAGPELTVADTAIACVPAGAETEISVTVTMPEIEGVVDAEFNVFDSTGVSVGEALGLLVDVSALAPTDQPTRFVRVRDVSFATSTSDPGADIDAVGVELPGGDVLWASQVVRYAPSDAVAHAESSASIGEPDAFYAWPDDTVCGVDDGFASLGGEGELVVRFDGVLLSGAEVFVLEVGDCEYAPGAFAIPDEVEVYVGTAPEGPWTLVANSVGPTVSGRVP